MFLFELSVPVTRASPAQTDQQSHSSNDPGSHQLEAFAQTFLCHLCYTEQTFDAVIMRAVGVCMCVWGHNCKKKKKKEKLSFPPST